MWSISDRKAKEINSYRKVTQSLIGCIFVLTALQIQDPAATICVHFNLHMSISVTAIQLQIPQQTETTHILLQPLSLNSLSKHMLKILTCKKVRKHTMACKMIFTTYVQIM